MSAMGGPKPMWSRQITDTAQQGVATHLITVGVHASPQTPKAATAHMEVALAALVVL